MNKFRVDDIIIGNKRNTGIYSGVGSICKVLRVLEKPDNANNDLVVAVLKEASPRESLYTQSYMFDLYKTNFVRRY